MRKKAFSIFGEQTFAITDESITNHIKDLDEGLDEVLERENLFSMIINIMQNAFSCYIKLFHFKEAL